MGRVHESHARFEARSDGGEPAGRLVDGSTVSPRGRR